jgi:dipeptidyl aminopeptidase/acylaminoacyl peptidase
MNPTMNTTFSGVPRACCALALIFGATANAEEQAAPVTYPQVSEAACPPQIISIPCKAGNEVPAVIRQPPGAGPFPAIIALHGGLSPYPVDKLKDETLTRPNYTRFLAAGFALVAPTFRSREENPQTRDALDDCLAVVDYVKKMPHVDPDSVAIFGGSGGGSLALELAGETDLCAVIAGEPATVLFTGLMEKGMADRNQAFQQRMKEPKKHLTPEMQQFTRAKIAQIHCPVLILHGDIHALKIINREYIVPELKAANKSVEYIEYAGQPHAFWWGAMDAAVGQKVFDDSMRFLTPNLKTQPVALDESLIKRVPAERERGEKAAGKRNRKAN